MPTMKTRWEDSLPAAAAEWQRQSWIASPRDVRVSEWTRHLAALDLSFDNFRDADTPDVGCGPTGLVYFLDGQRRRVGVDPTAKAFAAHNGYWGRRIELLESAAESLPFPPASFDAVVCVNVFDHTYKPADIVNEIARVARPGGMLVFHVALDSPLRILHKRVRRECRVLHPQCLSYGWVQEHVGRWFRIEQEVRDPEGVFHMTRRQLRYEAYWDGLPYRNTKSDRFRGHVWLRARRLSVG